MHTARHGVTDLKPKAPETTVEVPKLPSIFDRHSSTGLKFGDALDMGWQKLAMGKEIKTDFD